MKALHLIVLCLTGKIVFGLETGAPSKACVSMFPQHKPLAIVPPTILGKDLRTSPYEVKAEIVGMYVRLTVNGSRSVGGFLIQARQTENGRAIGKFNENVIAQYQDCTSKKV